MSSMRLAFRAAFCLELQNDDCNYEQQMDQSTADVAEKTQKPKNQENYKYRPQHKFYSG
jgi:hypothetical protein